MECNFLCKISPCVIQSILPYTGLDINGLEPGEASSAMSYNISLVYDLLRVVKPFFLNRPLEMRPSF